MERILTIVGQTAVGKTKIAIELAKRINGEIIGLDSRQIYFDLEIGTAQPTIVERNGIPHHLFGIRSPIRNISAGEYAKLVRAVAVDIKQRQKLPIICGGAGLYHRALRQGIFKESTSSLKIRKKLENEYDQNPQKLYERLQKLDPEYTQLVHINNKRRLVRALEIYTLTKVTPTEHFRLQKSVKHTELNLFTVLLTMDKEKLFERICRRTEQMLEDGLIDEVKKIIRKYDSNAIFPLNSIGYKQVIEYLNGQLSYANMVEEINIRTRQYAKSQLTWFKKDTIDLTIDLSLESNFKNIVPTIIERFNNLE